MGITVNLEDTPKNVTTNHQTLAAKAQGSTVKLRLTIIWTTLPHRDFYFSFPYKCCHFLSYIQCNDFIDDFKILIRKKKKKKPKPVTPL